MKTWIIRGGIVGFVLAVMGFLLAASGLVPVKASSGHWPITRWFLQFAKQRSVSTHSLGLQVPALDDPALVLRGAGHYEFGCRSCHGAPGEPAPRIARAMLPAPPPLNRRVREMDAAALFHIVKHGLKFTGMPAWPAQQRDDEVWAVVAFLQKMPELDRSAYRRLVDGEPAPGTTMQTLAPIEAARPIPDAVIRTCARCHGRDGLGRGSDAFPRLAGQRREYLRNSLRAFAHGRRHSGIMEPLAVPLDEHTIDELAGYFAELPRGDPPAANRGDPQLIALGRTIALEGRPAQRLPACVECHDPAGRRAKPAYPSLRGQPASYLEQQLELFARGVRGGSEYAHLMEEVAGRLEPEQRRAAAAYFASLRSESNEGDARD